MRNNIAILPLGVRDKYRADVDAEHHDTPPLVRREYTGRAGRRKMKRLWNGLRHTLHGMDFARRQCSGRHAKTGKDFIDVFTTSCAYWNTVAGHAAQSAFTLYLS